eukprot:2821473-Pyramimonas_sp.AAC.1
MKLSPFSKADGGACTFRAPRRPKNDFAILGGAAKCEIVITFEGCWGSPHSGAPSRPKKNLAIPGGLRSVNLSQLPSAAGRARTMGPHAKPKKNSPSLGRCEV